MPCFYTHPISAPTPTISAPTSASASASVPAAGDRDMEGGSGKEPHVQAQIQAQTPASPTGGGGGGDRGGIRGGLCDVYASCERDWGGSGSGGSGSRGSSRSSSEDSGDRGPIPTTYPTTTTPYPTPNTTHTPTPYTPYTPTTAPPDVWLCLHQYLLSITQCQQSVCLLLADWLDLQLHVQILQNKCYRAVLGVGGVLGVLGEGEGMGEGTGEGVEGEG
ncbi:hypothetical protein B484DRAFT_390985, partial [Ochromonadaceae sp. CCMP2298]